MSDRYLRLILTVIAIELAWIGLKDIVPTRLAAQARPAPTPVVITGIDFGTRPQMLPVGVVGGLTNVMPPVGTSIVPMSSRVEPGERLLRVDLSGGVNARIVDPVRIRTSPAEPLDVKSVQATGGPRPGL